MMRPDPDRARRALAWLAAPVVLLAASCSLMLDWEGAIAQQPCDSEGQCLEGYSCLGNDCIPLGSVERHDTCSESRQCEGYSDVFCSKRGGEEANTCRMKCLPRELFSTPEVCLGSEFCKPELENDRDRQWSATCFNSECSTGTDCRQYSPSRGDTCVAISTHAKACIVGCEIMWNDGVYSDTCTNTAATKFYCQPLGMASAQKLACVQFLATSGRERDELCHPLADPCQAGVACVNGFCRTYCDQSNPVQCIAGQVCCPSGPLSQPLFSYCANSCN